jgi:aspartate beta-hydroxylase
VAARPADVSAWIGLAFACRDLGDDIGHLHALDQALRVNPSHLPALLMKADHLAKSGERRAAHAFYRAVVSRAPALETLSPALRDEVRRAERQCAQFVRDYDSHLRDALADAGFDPATCSRRFTQSVDLLLGRKQIYLQSPTSFYFPELPQRQFYEREEFPWLAALEAKTANIREELLTVIGDAHAFAPYVRSDASRPPGEFGGLVDNLDWGAFYLIHNGAFVADAVARCPRTMEALGSVPLSATPGRTPSVLFSLLKPGVRIPPHTGYTNARLICHLPLVVPGNCGLRVGNEVRHWAEAEALIFDDSIEHEAWNDSAQPRVVLLFDIWRPELTPAERTLVAATLAAVGSYDAAPPA